jgi:hypothetical protein
MESEVTAEGRARRTRLAPMRYGGQSWNGWLVDSSSLRVSQQLERTKGHAKALSGENRNP